jgi:hypothetical protein
VVQSTDTGSTVKLVFTVQNGLGSVPVSVLTQVVGGGSATTPPPSLPTNTTLPSITGTAQEGQTLTSETGTWTGSPTGYGYQWLRCDTGGGNCGPIVGAGRASYGVTSGDVGSTLRIQVVATNASGSATAVSDATGVVASAAIAVAGTASFSGTLNAKQSSQTFPLTVGAGQVKANLTFSKWSSLTLTITATDGTLVASGSGPSVLTLISMLSAGSYRFKVSGSGKAGCAFSLGVNYVAP